jgi:hypothetical protein
MANGISKITNSLIAVAGLIVTLVVVLLLITKSHTAVTGAVDTTDRDENSLLADSWSMIGAGTGANADETGLIPTIVLITILVALFALLLGAIKHLKGSTD